MPLLTLLGQKPSTHTIGGTSQLDGFSSSAALQVGRKIGGTSQLDAFSSSAALQVGRKIGGSSQLAAFTSTGTIQVVSSAVAASPTGGLWQAFEDEKARQAREAHKRNKARAEARAIKDKLHRELALENRKLEAREARLAELSTLTDTIAEYESEIRHLTSERIEFVTREAIEKRTFSAMERMERELGQMRMDDIFLLKASIIIINQ